MKRIEKVSTGSFYVFLLLVENNNKNWEQNCEDQDTCTTG